MTCPDSLVHDLRSHVQARGGPTVQNGAWQMMLDAAADEIERLQREIAMHAEALAKISARADRYQAVVVGLRSELTHDLALIEMLLQIEETPEVSG